MKNKVIKLKKYLFLISILFFVSTLGHLIYTFLYHDADLTPIEGGSISEGIIGRFPELNPLKVSSGNNKYMLGLLYRSLLKYNTEEEKIVSDIASCDISNLVYIECYLTEGISWSNGEKITPSDIISTYKVLQNSAINPITASLLSETTISQKDDAIIFKNKKEDINFLNIFFQPIVQKQVIDTRGEEQLTGKFDAIDGVYSGKYKISSISQDQTIGITKFILEKNEFYKDNDILIDQFIIKLFPDTNSFLKNKDTVNIFNDNENIIGGSIPRFSNNKYILPQYISLFINKENIASSDLRSSILKQVNRDNLLKILGESNFEAIVDPYISEKEENTSLKNKNFEKIMARDGFYKKNKIIDDFLSDSKNSSPYSQEASITATGETQAPEIGETSLDISDFQKDSETIVSPSYIEKYNFVSKDDILLKGNVTEGTTAVYINDYQLQGFKPGNKEFFYRLKEQSYETITEGNNTYKIYFENESGKQLVEEIHVMYFNDEEKLTTEKELFIKNLIAEREREEIFLAKQKEDDAKLLLKNKAKLDELKALNDNYYYNDTLENFKLKLYYIDTEHDLEKTAIFIKNSLEEIGVEIELHPISLSGVSQILNNKDVYDMILIGINLGYFDFNIFPYFHSSQAKGGYNFSNIRKTGLDILLEELKGNISSQERINQLKSKITDIIGGEYIHKTLYTPKINLLIDKKLKNFSLPKYIPNKSLRSSILENTYTQEKRIINFENKGIIDFFTFILGKLND